MTEWPHVEAPNGFGGDGFVHACKCGANFTNREDLDNHLWVNREITDGVAKCRECGLPAYLPGPSHCKSNHFDSTSPEGLNCFPDNPIFEKLPQFDGPFNIPSVFTLPGPTLLEVLKALRDTFAATNGRIPTKFLDALISQYDFTITMETTTNAPLEDTEPHEEVGFGD